MWRFGAPPDYTVANYAFATGKTKAHAPGSLEMIVENLVKTWEMERSHKSDPSQHKTVDQERFSIGANGGKMFNNIEANEVGNYNLLLDTADKALYDAEATSWDDSHEMFGDAFAAFPCAPRPRGILARALRAPHSCLDTCHRTRASDRGVARGLFRATHRGIHLASLGHLHRLLHFSEWQEERRERRARRALWVRDGDRQRKPAALRVPLLLRR